MEIERKFLVAEPPDLEAGERLEIEQGYLALAGDAKAEVRLRRQADELLLTVKGGAVKAGSRRRSSLIGAASRRCGR